MKLADNKNRQQKIENQHAIVTIAKYISNLKLFFHCLFDCMRGRGGEHRIFYMQCSCVTHQAIQLLHDIITLCISPILIHDSRNNPLQVQKQNISNILYMKLLILLLLGNFDMLKFQGTQSLLQRQNIDIYCLLLSIQYLLWMREQPLVTVFLKLRDLLCIINFTSF